MVGNIVILRRTDVIVMCACGAQVFSLSALGLRLGVCLRRGYLGSDETGGFYQSFGNFWKLLVSELIKALSKLTLCELDSVVSPAAINGSRILRDRSR